MSNNLDKLQSDLEKDIIKRKKKIKGTGFAKQRQIMEQSGYYVKNKKRQGIKLIDKRKK